MSGIESLIIVGAGLAGISAAGAAREAGHAGPLVLISNEATLPYDRPPLSKRVLTDPGAEDRIALRDRQWFSDLDIDLRLGREVTLLDRGAKRVTCDDGTTLTYGALILATGSRVRRLPALETGPLPVHYLRTRDDAVTLRGRLTPGAHIVVLGGGVIGLEVAGSAAKLGCRVTVIEAADRLMARSLSPSISSFLESYHRRRGVDIVLGATVDRQTETDTDRGACLLLSNGRTVEADALLAGIGVAPDTDLAERAGLVCNNGVLVDAFGRTSDPNIYAAGDATTFESPLYERALHLETWQNAQSHGQAVGRNVVALTGAAEAAAYSETPWFWSDQHDLNLQLVGLAIGDAEVERRGDESDSFVTFHLERGRLMGATLINAGGQKRPIQRMIACRATVAAERLADPSVRLRALAKEIAD